MSKDCIKCGIPGRLVHGLCAFCDGRVDKAQATLLAACEELEKFNPHESWCGDSLTAEEASTLDNIMDRIIDATKKVKETAGE